MIGEQFDSYRGPWQVHAMPQTKLEKRLIKVLFSLLIFPGALTSCSEPDGQQGASREAANVLNKAGEGDEGQIFDRAGFIPMKDGLVSHWAEGMTCSPENLDSMSILRVTFLRPHGGEIAIITPSGEWYIYAWLAMTESRSDIRDAERIKEADILDINVRNAVGLGPRSDGRSEPIFKEPGTYRLIVSQNIEVDREGLEIDSYCHFNFRSKN